jgi:raffinose/stachyose/melibiose transport system permease protein
MIIRGFMGTVPRDILESAQIDGANSLQVLIRIMIPISIPGIVTSSIFIVINCWNELLFANLLSQSDVSRTIQVAIRSFLTTFAANYAHAFAAMAISVIPTVLIYAFLTDKIIDGMTSGAVKG